MRNHSSSARFFFLPGSEFLVLCQHHRSPGLEGPALPVPTTTVGTFWDVDLATSSVLVEAAEVVVGLNREATVPGKKS